MASWRTGPNPSLLPVALLNRKQPSFLVLNAAAETQAQPALRELSCGTRAKWCPTKCLPEGPTCVLPDLPGEHPVPM